MLKEQLGQEMLEEMRAKLEAMSFSATAWCFVHERLCFLDPRSDPNLRASRIIECAGPCCPPWCTFSSRNDRWLSSATLPALVWAYSTRYTRPDFIFHENAPGYDDGPIRAIFNDRHTSKRRRLGRHTPSQASLFSDPPDGFGEGRTGQRADAYMCVQPPSLCPTMFGIPTRRKRKYTMWMLSLRWHLDLPPRACFLDTFEEMFRKSLVATADSYMCGTDAEVGSQLRSAMRLQGFDFDDDALARCSGAMALTPGEAVRCREYEQFAQDRGLKVGDCWTVPVALINVTQRATFIRCIDTETTPTLMRRTALFDMVRSRMLLPMEYWAIQGYAAPGTTASSVVKTFPFAGLESSLGDTRQLTGNGMHLSCIGSMLMFSFACCVPNASSESHSSSLGY